MLTVSLKIIKSNFSSKEKIFEYTKTITYLLKSHKLFLKKNPNMKIFVAQ